MRQFLLTVTRFNDFGILLSGLRFSVVHVPLGTNYLPQCRKDFGNKIFTVDCLGNNNARGGS